MAYIRVNGEENSRRRLWIKNSLFRQFLVIVILLLCCMAGSYAPVSYTHLDVYKRQVIPYLFEEETSC